MNQNSGWIDLRADQVGSTRLCSMRVLEKVDSQNVTQEEHLTTKFVYDWRVEDFTTADGTVCLKASVSSSKMKSQIPHLPAEKN